MKKWKSGTLVQKFDHQVGAVRAVVGSCPFKNQIKLTTKSGYEAYGSQRFFEGRGWEKVQLLSHLESS